ncbi:MAG: tetratricopeptide repeat protein [Kiritimatiellae bacterium]|nr:tetratricopeptide repeat protein [Kiritimatiellia bacterium]
MKEQKKDASRVIPVPENLPEELLPLYDWWKANGTHFLITAACVIIVCVAVFGFRQYRAGKIAMANQELLQAQSVEDLEAAVTKYGSMTAGKALRLRLAKAYFDAGKYEAALNTYDAYLSKGGVEQEGFADIARVGHACALEGLERYDESLAAYRAFQKDYPESFLIRQAQFGEARVLCLQGKKDEANKFLENLKAKVTGKTTDELAIANLQDVIARYEPRISRSLFQMAEEVSKTPAVPEVKPAAKAEPAPKPATPAPAKPVAAKPVSAPAAKPAAVPPPAKAEPPKPAPAPAPAAKAEAVKK